MGRQLGGSDLGMADRTKSGAISTAKSRRKDSAARNKALGLATLGRRTGRERELDTAVSAPDQPDHADLADLVPEARPSRPATYVMVEHRRRDSGAVARALDLTAPDVPTDRGRVLPVADADGAMLEFAVICVTHNTEPCHVATASKARKEVKSSHKWCETCRLSRASTPATRSKAAAATRRRNG
jgi:hypothetical protein